MRELFFFTKLMSLLPLPVWRGLELTSLPWRHLPRIPTVITVFGSIGAWVSMAMNMGIFHQPLPRRNVHANVPKLQFYSMVKNHWMALSQGRHLFQTLLSFWWLFQPQFLFFPVLYLSFAVTAIEYTSYCFIYHLVFMTGTVIAL